MKENKNTPPYPEISNDYGSKRDWEEVRRIASGLGLELTTDKAREIVYFIRKLAELAVDALDRSV